eukprot:m.55462 g.55462  ORF g.55462 m.55462 type:complete len:814 (-) comp13653_c0_seq4:234-2675(-)
MYGFITEGMVEWLQSRETGVTDLEEVVSRCKAAGLSMDVKYTSKQPDEETLSILAIAAEVVGVSVEDVLFKVGQHLIPPLVSKGYLPVVQSLGETFFIMISNLDTMHANFAQVYPSMVGPMFKAVRNDDDTITVHYYSSRVGIAPFAKGLLDAVATAVYGLSMTIDHLKSREEHGHDVFHLTFDNPLKAFGEDEGSKTVLLPRKSRVLNQNLILSDQSIDALFPWHVAFDKDFKIVSLGTHLAGRFHKSMHGHHLDDVLRLVRPLATRFQFTSDNDYDETSVVFSVVNEKDAEPEIRCPITGKVYRIPKVDDERIVQAGIAALESNLYVRGQLMYEEEMEALIFLGIPCLSDFEEMREHGLTLSQFPVHSSGRDMLFAATHSMATIESGKQLEKLTTSLDNAMKELDAEKDRIHKLLHSILPPAIAESLSTGVTPEAERYDRVSILFSDIVGFTKISSSVPPCEVMDMLNELFSKFDALCEKYNVFKVETIGDAYMVASGLPVPTPHYADNLAGFAIEMVACAEEVPSPLDGEPLRIRVGMHTGPCMAGVVGRKRPRYCLFGDSVNTASRMESTGVPAAIQVSYAFVKSLTVRDDWNTMSRGIIDVKGKGKMKTHFLLGKKHSPVQLSPPDASETKPVSNVGTPPVMEYGSVCHSPMPLQSVPSSPRLVGGSNFALIDIRSANTDHSTAAIAAATVTQEAQPSSAVVTPSVDETYYTIQVDLHSDLITVPFAHSDMSLSELVEDIAVAVAESTASYRLFLDAQHKKMLLPRMSLRVLHMACVNANLIKATSNVIKVYLGKLGKLGKDTQHLFV